MNWDQIEGKWKQMKGAAKKQWGKLTDDDLDYMAGSRDQFVGRLQERYGIAKEEAQEQADRWLEAQGQTRTTETTTTTTRHSGGGA
jgi:uncharacterized protein YjbJ (UPF0337 family)